MACGKYAAELALAKTGDAQAMKRLFSLMLCRNTVLLVLYIVMFVLPIAAGEALDPNQDKILMAAAMVKAGTYDEKRREIAALGWASPTPSLMYMHM